ncbi:MAG: glycosyltransferase, partial [Wenzhouxiangella sp.]
WQLRLLPPGLAARSIQVDNWSFPAQPAASARHELRSRLGLGRDALVFGTLGRVEPSKGLDAVMEAFHRAKPAGASLVIVGDGKARRGLQAKAGPDVHFVGYSDRPRDWLEAFDIFVSGARSEPFGLVFLEAMHAGLPIIASASEGARHLQQHIGAPLITIDDVEGFAEAFSAAAAKPPQRRRYELERFDARARSADITAFYDRCLLPT